jgi:hypothetical protein
MNKSEQRRWMPLAQAIDRVAARKAIAHTEAWEAIKADIGYGELPAQGTDDHGMRTSFEPHWIELTAKFLSPGQAARPLFNDPGDNLPAHESRGETHPLTDFPTDGMLWFDRTKAAQNRLALARTADNRAAVSLPPRFLRDIVVDAVRLNELYPDTKKPRRGRMEAPFWPEARKVAIEWLVDEGCPAPRDGNQSRLEQHITDWLTERGHNAAEPTIRRHVTKWIAEQREFLGV